MLDRIECYKPLSDAVFQSEGTHRNVARVAKLQYQSKKRTVITVRVVVE